VDTVSITTLAVGDAPADVFGSRDASAFGHANVEQADVRPLA
jgi:hypothetical protein